MKTMLRTLILFSVLIAADVSYSQVAMNFTFDTPYGSNEAVGKYAEINGMKMYYEEYGTGEPMFLIHGNGADIRSMGNQIDYFKTKYRVIAADSRGHGKSELKTDSLTYVQMAQDWADLATHLGVDSLNIIGWSDGGILALLMGIHHPSKVKKIVTMGANLRPDTTAVYPFAVNWVARERQNVQAKIAEHDTTRNWHLLMQHLGLLGDQPTISRKDLARIQCPVLIVAGDKDIIREEHTVEIYQSIKKAHLCILPGETHFTPASDPELFNKIADKFIREPFTRPDSDWTKHAAGN